MKRIKQKKYTIGDLVLFESSIDDWGCVKTKQGIITKTCLHDDYYVNDRLVHGFEIICKLVH